MRHKRWHIRFVRLGREFKNNAVALVRGGRTITEVGRDLGVSKWSLGHWVRRAEEGQRLSEPKTLALETPQQRALRRLRQELEYVSRQRDILSLNRSTAICCITNSLFLRELWHLPVYLGRLEADCQQE
jgi:transposase